MNIIIVGCGKVGQTLAEQLNENDNNITVIDTNANLVHAIAHRYDILGVVGNGAIHSIQHEAGIEKADLLIAAYFVRPHSASAFPWPQTNSLS